MQTLFSIIGILITILFVIGTHEAAHFAMARFLGVKVLRFSIGFGKALYKRKDRSGTEYVVALIPLGGYVKMLDENEGAVPESEKHLAFNRQPFYKKFLIVLAGPLTNLLCALVLYWLIFMIGFMTIKPIIGSVTTGSIADKAGLTANQEIVSIDSRPISTWMNVIFRIITHTGTTDKVDITVKNPTQPSLKTHVLDFTTWHLDPLNPDPLTSLGITPFAPDIPLIIGTISAGSPAASKLQVGDKIIAINHNAIKSWDDLIVFTTAHPEQPVTLTVLRSGKVQNLDLTIGSKRHLLFSKVGYLGIAPNIVIPPALLREVKFPPAEAFIRATQELYDFTYLNLLLFGKILTGKVSLQSLGGPITIFESAGSALNVGVVAFLGFLAFLSLSIGVINLLPIPGLDGGHLFFQVIEAIIHRPIPEKILASLYYMGFFLLFFVLIQAVINDVLRLY